jgi:hypothetical protein
MRLEVLQDSVESDVVGAVSTDGTGRHDLGIPVLGRQEELLNLTETGDATTLCVAINDNLTRQKIQRDLTLSGWTAAVPVSACGGVTT